VSGGAWFPSHVGEAICLVNSDNERDPCPLLDVPGLLGRLLWETDCD
jgi:hypothetical protein